MGMPGLHAPKQVGDRVPREQARLRDQGVRKDGLGVSAHGSGDPVRRREGAEVHQGTEQAERKVVAREPRGVRPLETRAQLDVDAGDVAVREHKLRTGGVKVVRGIVPDEFLKTETGFVNGEVYEKKYEISPFVKPDIIRVLPEGLRDRWLNPLESPVSRMGGKKQLKRWLITRFPRDVKTYVEPFMGSVQVLLAKPWRNKIEIINDYDAGLVHFFRYLVFDPIGLGEFINALPAHEGMILGFREELRENRLTGIAKAAAVYICGRTAFNAMATDTLGEYASSPSVLLRTDVDPQFFRRVAARLRTVDIRTTSYKRVLSSVVKTVKGGIFIYLDPPYDQTKGYQSWDQELGFGWTDQVLLSEYMVELDKKGGRFIMTNSHTDRLVELWGGYKKADGSPRFHLTDREVYYSLAAQASTRRGFKELIVSNYPLIDSNDRELQPQQRMF